MKNYIKFKLSFFVALCMLIGLQVNAATITVNSGESIQAAVDLANPGDIISVQAGTYTQKILFSGSADSGSAGSFITLRANGVVIIDGSGLSPNGREGLITISGASYIKIEGFEIRNFKTTTVANTPVGIYVDGTCTNIQILNNEIYNIEQNKSNCNQNNNCFGGAHGIGVFGTTTGGIKNILLQGNTVRNCVLLSSEAFVLNSNVDGFEVYDNIVHDNNNIGFDFIGYEPWDCSSCTLEQRRVRNGVVSGNTAHHNSSGSNPWYTGDTSAGGFYVDGGRNIVFAGNISHHNDYGFEIGSEWNGRKTEDILMVNNVIYLNSRPGLIVGGYSSTVGTIGEQGGGGSTENLYVYNNSFYNNQQNISNVNNLFGTEIRYQYRVLNSRFFNNVLYTRGNISQIHDTNCSPCPNNSNTGNTWGNNIWFGDNGITGSVLGSNNVIQNPNYVAASTGNLNVSSGSPAINAGNAQSNLTDWNDSFWNGVFYANGDIPAHGTLVNNEVVDINGDLRIQDTSIDIGAYEADGGTAPNAPSNLSASTASASQINLSWSDNSNNEDQFKIQRSTTATNGFSFLAMVGANVTSYSDTGLPANTTYYYRVQARNSTGNSSYSATASATTSGSSGGLPSPWVGADVGNPTITGAASESGGTFTVNGAGSDIWGSSDQFQFVYQNLNGDGEIIAKVTVLENTHDWAKGGVMIRETLNSNSKHTMVVVTPSNGTRMQGRISTGGSSFNQGTSTGVTPYWVRLVRAGSSFTAYKSPDGTSWTQAGTQTISMTTNVFIGLVVTSHNAGSLCTTTFTNVSVQNGSNSSLPSPWVGADVGNPTITGAASESGGTFTVNGAGSDIWGSSDQFQFVYQNLNGDGEIIAKVTVLENTHDWAKGGVMIRETLNSNSKHTMVVVTPSNGTRMQGRISTGGSSFNQGTSTGVTPYWVRLVRAGSSFTAYKSPDGTSWTQAGTQTISMTTNVFIGLVVTSHNAGSLCTTTFTNVSVQNGSNGNRLSSAVSNELNEVKNEEIINEFNVYPNPVMGSLNIDYNMDKEGLVQIKILGVDGKIYFATEEFVKAGNYSKKIDTRKIHKGMVILKIITNQDVNSRPVIIEN